MKIELLLDQLTGHDDKGIIGKINVEVGDSIKKGDILFIIEGTKGTVKYKAKYDGVVKEILIEEGTTVLKNQPIGSMDVNQQTISHKPTKTPKKAYSFGISTPVKESISCDVLIIGGGPGGYVAAIRAAQLGYNTVLIEKDKLGGTCLNYGCIPTKALVQSVAILNNIKECSTFGFSVNDYKIDFEKVIERKDTVVEQLVSGIYGLMKKNNIRVIAGEAVVDDTTTIHVTTKKINATINYNKLILAMGASPIILPIKGAELAEVLTSKEMLELSEIPKSLTVIGGGIIGMEIAFIYNALGTHVSVVEYLPQILSCVDKDVSDIVKQAASEKGIKIYESARANSIEKTLNDQMITEIEINKDFYHLSSEKVLMGVGRSANLDALDLELLGIKLNERKNGIAVNEFMQTSSDNIYAIGDITNKVQLAHVASHQGMVAAEHIHGGKAAMHYDLIPSAIFTHPEIGMVGITENEAINKNLDVKIVKFPFAASGKALAMNEPLGFTKLIINKESKSVIGASIVGGHGSDLIAVLANIIQTKTPLEDAIKVIYAHPTLSEGIHEALLMADDRGIHFG
jgi:dihydrolipoamide dehydrogenase